MIVQCAWCKKIMGEKEPLSDKSVSHTICRACSIDFLGVDPEEVKKTMSNPCSDVKVEYGIHNGILGHWLKINGETFGPFRSKDEANKEADAFRELIASSTKENPQILDNISLTKAVWNDMSYDDRVDVLIELDFTEEDTEKFAEKKYTFESAPKWVQTALVKYIARPKIKNNPGAKWHREQADKARTAANEYAKQYGHGSQLVTEKLGEEIAHFKSLEKSKELGINPILSTKQAGEIYDKLFTEEKADILTDIGISSLHVRQLLTWKFRSLPAGIQNKIAKYFDGLTSNPKKRESRAQFCVERVVDPKRFDKRSFRTTYARAHRLTVGCPKGQWDAKKQVCRVPMEVQRILHPAGEAKCPVPGKELKSNPGANWHREQAVFSKIAEDEAFDAGNKESGILNRGQRLAHERSARWSEEMGINPKDSVIQKTAVELYTQGHGVDDVRILLQKEFGISKKEAEYWARRAGRISRGQVKG